MTVTDEDRKAAASGYFAWCSGNETIPNKMLAGRADDHSMVQAFARHRIAERERVVGEIVEWMRDDEEPYPDSYDIADEIEAKFGGRDGTQD
jgi:hypothetical protein